MKLVTNDVSTGGCVLPLASPLRRKTANRSIDRLQDTQRQYDRPWSTFRDVAVSRQCGTPRFRADTRVFTRMTHMSMHRGLHHGCIFPSRLSFYCIIFTCNIPKSASLQFTAINRRIFFIAFYLFSKGILARMKIVITDVVFVCIWSVRELELSKRYFPFARERILPPSPNYIHRFCLYKIIKIHLWILSSLR